MYKIVLKKFVLKVSLIVGAIVLISSALKAQQLDMVIFGDENAETAHSLDQLNTTVGNGGLDESYRKLEGSNIESSYIGVTLSVDPEVQNYLTLKLWGSDTLESKQYLYFYYYKTIFGNLAVWDEIGSAGSDPSEIINWTNTSTYPNRFVYVTYLLPDEILGGQDSMHFRIAGAELSIYKAYVHTNPYFKPDEVEQQGSAPAFNDPNPSPNGLTQIEHLHTQLDLAVDRFLTWQYYGEEWDTWVANGWAPEIMTGALNTHGVKDTSWTLNFFTFGNDIC